MRIKTIRNEKSEEMKAEECFSTDYAVLIPKDHPNMYHPMRYWGK